MSLRPACRAGRTRRGGSCIAARPPARTRTGRPCRPRSRSPSTAVPGPGCGRGLRAPPPLVSAPALWFILRDYQQQRILTFLNPERDPLGTGWNIIQSKTAIGSGGLFGKGLFQGTQSHLDFLPESQTDFIIAVLAEELGLFGIVILLIMYLLLMGRGVIISLQAQDTFGRLLSGTITFTFFVYVFVNIGMVSGVVPVVGIPLPMVSYGGSSVLTLFAGFGIIMSIHTHRRIIL